ncbi:aminoglycoside phosphotransferase family protein [Streptomyces sp. Q6]|uniref:Aminoglycoside phosphotransferase family protein n=1 Tax=Streptomyces citrinus TaxID=3118173 RepID=A0ACD5AD15_9ACTN
MGAVIAPSASTSGQIADADVDDVWRGVVARAQRHGEGMSGHHNLNHVVTLSDQEAARLGLSADTRVMVRRRKPGIAPVVIRTWREEQAVLGAMGGTLRHVPQCLARFGDTSIHSYMEGTPLSSICRNGKPVDALLIEAFAGLLADMAKVPSHALPACPEYWPRDGDSRGFLRTLLIQAEGQIRQPNWAEFGGLFVALGVPENALRLSDVWAPNLTRRPFQLLHGDLHRDNVIVTYEGRRPFRLLESGPGREVGGITYDGEPPMVCVDWELATYGDPLHDLAVHLVRMQYPPDQESEVIRCWEKAMGQVRPEATRGLDADLRHYIDFEHAQSVYPDVIRAVGSLGENFSQSDLEGAAAEVHRALTVARRPLRLRNVLEPAAIEPLLYRWRVARGARHRGTFSASINWQRDERVQLREHFTASEVEEALWAEGAATARQVFKGTAHLGTVVRVAGYGPVMVRRKVGNATPIEPRSLSEHSVLRAIEDSGAAVSVPKVLALGVSDVEDQFTIQSYVGPSDIQSSPVHPVHGLLPGEAHDLVDQLVALSQVDNRSLTQDMSGVGFYAWMCSQLALMVRQFSRKTKDLAAMLGLPDEVELELRLLSHDVTDRHYSLLHGDLNPWNLVRQERGFGLALIDWEMAMVGDPLYDLVRHIHLTPTTREIRERMYSRWERCLPERFTRGWEGDVPAYRGLEQVRSAYVDLDRLVTGSGLDAPNVRRAVGSYKTTLRKALHWLEMPQATPQAANPYLALALPHADD